MTEKEFELIDELYFLISFEQLQGLLDWEERELAALLEDIFKKGWLRCYNHAGEQLSDELIDIPSSYMKYNYLATKAGLKAHNR